MTKNNRPEFDHNSLQRKGLNIHAVIDLDNLSSENLKNIEQSGVDLQLYNQLIVIGHLGQKLWKNISVSLTTSEHPIDDFSIASVQSLFETHYPAQSYEIIYPGDKVIGLQQLGSQLGWHYPSPFKVGINNEWGSWFAYRAVVLSDSHFAETKPLDSSSPCVDCQQQFCISACPAQALDNNEFEFTKCIDFRKQQASACRNQCLARLACPVGEQYRYTDEQVFYHYGVSMKTIESHY